MTKEKLYETLNGIDDELVEEAERYKKKKVLIQFKWGILVACFVLIVIIGIIQVLKLHTVSINGNDISEGTNKDNDTIGDSYDSEYTIKISIGEREAIYQQVFDKQDQIEEQRGKEFQQTEENIWFYRKDLDTLQYLIMQDKEGKLTLWRFLYFITKGDTYTYKEVFETIYGIYSAEDIISITTTAEKKNNTEKGQLIYNAIGKHTYSNPSDMVAFYNIIANVECRGGALMALPERDETRFTYSFSTDAKDKLDSGELNAGTRHLNILLSNGQTINRLLYDALVGDFYEYNGVYMKGTLTEEEVAILNKIFEIE